MGQPSENKKPSRAYSITKAALKATATYYYPFTNGRWSAPASLRDALKGTLKTAFNTARFAGILTAVYVANQVIQPATAQFFPSGEDYLKAHNIDPDIAAKLSNNQIYVRTNDFWGRAHEFGDFPTLIGGVIKLIMPFDEANAFALRRGMMNPVNTRFFNQCHVSLQGDNVTAEDSINALAGRKSSHKKSLPLEHVPMSDLESRMGVALHEFAHCHDDNIADISIAESDADLRGLTIAAEAFDNPEIFNAFMYARALNTSNAPHDTSLYLDQNRGKNTDAEKEAQETEENIVEAEQDDGKLTISIAIGAASRRGPTEDVFDLARIFSNGTFYSVNEVQQAQMINTMLQNYSILLTEDAVRRGELFVEAAKYFFPSQIDKIEEPFMRVNNKPANPAP